jgi:hypothetical protein
MASQIDNPLEMMVRALVAYTFVTACVLWAYGFTFFRLTMFVLIGAAVTVAWLVDWPPLRSIRERFGTFGFVARVAWECAAFIAIWISVYVFGNHHLVSAASFLKSSWYVIAIQPLGVIVAEIWKFYAARRSRDPEH